MQRTTLCLLAVCLAMALAACGGPQLSTDWKRGTDFASFDTYSWRTVPSADGSAGATIPGDPRIRATIDRELAAKGFRRLDEGGDFVVSSRVVYQNETTQRSVDTSWDAFGIPGSRPRPTANERRDVEVTATIGTLVIAVFEAESQDLVWAGEAAEDAASSATPDERQRRWSEVAVQLIAEFPPG